MVPTAYPPPKKTKNAPTKRSGSWREKTHENARTGHGVVPEVVCGSAKRTRVRA